MIEQHDGLMSELFGRARAPRPRLRPLRAEAPEGVALYQCHVMIPHDDGRVAGMHPCARGLEARPYEPIPYHCDRPMVLVGYAWDRDVAP